jgi:tetratricopeptide (TPR) repeat protein
LIPDKTSKHVWAAEYYLNQIGHENDPELISNSQIEAGIAAWSHFIKAEEHVRAIEVLNRLRPPLMNRGQYEQVMFLIEQTPKSSDNEDWYAMDKARILSLWGDFNGAVTTINSLVDSEDERIAREAVLVLATIYNEHNKPNDARKLLEVQHERVLKNAHPRAHRRFLFRLVETHSLLGNLEQALAWASKITQACETEGDEISGALSLRQMATVLLHQKKLDMALSLSQISHNILIKHKRLRDAAISQLLTASIYKDLGNWEYSSKCLAECLKIFIAMGDRKNSTICRQQIETMKAMG